MNDGDLLMLIERMLYLRGLDTVHKIIIPTGKRKNTKKIELQCNYNYNKKNRKQKKNVIIILIIMIIIIRFQSFKVLQRAPFPSISSWLT